MPDLIGGLAILLLLASIAIFTLGVTGAAMRGIRPVEDLFEGTEDIPHEHSGPDSYVYEENGVRVVVRRGTKEYDEVADAINRGRMR